MAYEFYLDGMLLPVTPDSLELKIANQNKTINLISGGEVNVVNSPGLTKVSFDFLIPARNAPYVAGKLLDIPAYLGKLELLKTGGRHFPFVVTRSSPRGELLFDTNLPVTLEEYSIKEDAGKLGLDTQVSVELLQWREFGTKLVEIQIEQKKAAATPPRDTSTAPARRTYTVVRGDCLWNIAKKYLGSGARYTEIFNLNRDKIKNPNLIYPGQVLTLP